MTHILYIHTILAFLVCTVAPAHAFIGSAYRITIEGLGTVILLGDQQDERPEVDQEQFGMLTEFLQRLAQREASTVVNLETLYPAPEYYADADSRSSMARNRLSEREVAPNLRALVSTLGATELKNKIIFTASDPRRSEIWDIGRTKDLKPMVVQALKRAPIDFEKATLNSIELDHEHIIKKYNRFLERSESKIPRPLYLVIANELNNRFVQAKEARKNCKSFFQRYSNLEKNLGDQTIQDIIYGFAMKKLGNHAINFDKYNDEKQEKIVNLVTSSFMQKMQTKFSANYAGNLVHTPWVMDLFNAFTRHKAQTAVFYANDSHIHYITLFLESLKKDLDGNTITFETVYKLKEKPLTREQFQKVLGLG